MQNQTSNKSISFDVDKTYYYVNPNPKYVSKKNEGFEEVLNISNSRTITYPRKGTTITTVITDCGVIENNDNTVRQCMRVLRKFEEKHNKVIYADKSKMYKKAQIPKRSGGMRELHIPSDELKAAQKELVKILSNDFYMLHHTAAYGFIKGRSTVDAVKKHSEDNFFMYMDLENFFDTCKMDFVLKTLKRIYPVCEVVKTEEGNKLFDTVMSIAFFCGSLPQGSPASPYISNLVMIPIDFMLNNIFSSKEMTYSRYADNITVSSKNKFGNGTVKWTIIDAFKLYGAPFWINEKKTHRQRKGGANWSLGIMTNHSGNLSIGHKKKDYLKAAIFNYSLDKKNGNTITYEREMNLKGIISYYLNVDPDKVLNILGKANIKTGFIFDHTFGVSYEWNGKYIKNRKSDKKRFIRNRLAKNNRYEYHF